MLNEPVSEHISHQSMAICQKNTDDVSKGAELARQQLSLMPHDRMQDEIDAEETASSNKEMERKRC